MRFDRFYFALVLALTGVCASNLAVHAQEIDYRSLSWEWDVNGCQHTNSPSYNQKLETLGKLAFGEITDKKGCVTTRYLEQDYDADCSLGICSEAHAGVDLRARPSPEFPVIYAVEGGKVVVKSFEPADGHSTLIVLNYSGSRKTLYLHMSEINVAEGDIVHRGDPIGRAGGVGAGAPHLHFEVWPSDSPPFVEDRKRAISGSACKAKVCTKDEVVRFTMDPIASIGRQIDVGPAPVKKVVDSSAELTNTEILRQVTDFYTKEYNGGICADYFVLRDLEIVELRNRDKDISVYTLMSLELREVQSTNEKFRLLACFGGGFHNDSQSFGQIRHLLSKFHFEASQDKWRLKSVDWSTSINHACLCPWIFVEEKMRVCGCPRPY